MRPPSRYFAASIALLLVVIAVYATSTARRTQAALRAELEQKALALADAVEVGSRNAIKSSVLAESMLAERLLDNARLVDALVARPVAPVALRALAERNHLRRVDLIDADGRPWTPPEPGMMMRGPHGPGAPMAPFMWGRRWTGAPGEPAASPPPATVTDRRFWDGTVFGVAVPATSFRGVIAVHADAADVVRFREDVGVERQLADLGHQSGVAAVSLIGPDLTVLADSDAARVGRRVDDPALVALAARPAVLSRLVERDGATRFEVVRPLTLDGTRVGLLAIALSTAPMAQAWRHDLRAAAALAGAALAAGGLGLGFIFWLQQRHMRDVAHLQSQVARGERLAALCDVAAAFAHEVRNPLNAVSIGLQRLGTEFSPEPAEEYARFVTLMQGEVRRLNGIVEEFIGLARPLPLTPASFGVDELLRELVALTEGPAHAAGVSVRLDMADPVPPLVADRDHVKQVLLNLALNAVQAMTEGGTLTLGAEGGRDTVVFVVTDTGRGMTPEVRARMFDPYFTTRRDGLGLGLTIARRIVEAHDGRIDVDSAPGKGTTIRVTLPLQPR